MLVLKLLRSVALTLLLFLAIYMPAFLIVSALHLTPTAMVPAVIALTLVTTCALMGWAIQQRWLTAEDFGWQWPAYRYVLYALALGVLLGTVVTVVLAHANEPGMPEGVHLAPWQAYLCFALGAPVQEEVVFRGLLQSTLARSLLSARLRVALAGIAASLSIALLFGVIHLKVGPVTACAACLLGVLAGELKRYSGSLLPGILCHALFNLGGLLLAFG
ncbi:CPBP family intramembrane glutamic endopeptidase [Dyella nitratireducens]|uniref:CAAX prenyl protease 2/Lysostaphin resistance protein A-like domain-containing protein n=1 Tax=Dyella nitratireducens TaxID=1849580 RepID=A0ABQ1FIP1_9GAMM|nr:CPBP family intramembrane glutamic endopeptidase [Dyella nitratireducens]GGA16595.1 hypothetical protein GCM10010981_00290 [Dyella nitratireducens]GLQ44911.1 hypothetical protein GCM10007902_47610 [Dyella nitratireducens]